MDETFAATGIAHTHAPDGGRSASVTLMNAEGRKITITLAPSAFSALRGALATMTDPASGGPTATKLPKGFAVGAGRFEPVVLVRFENDAPYGLAAAHAAELGRALIEEAAGIAEQRPPSRQ